MGEPDDPTRFVRCEDEGRIVYISHELLSHVEPETGKLWFYLDGYGRFSLRFLDPIPLTERENSPASQ